MSTRRVFLMQTTAAFVAAGSAEVSAVAWGEGRPKPALKTCRIPHTDLNVSRLAFGCAMLGVDPRGADFSERTAAMVHVAYDQGIRFFDLADVYGEGNAEVGMGRALKESPGMRTQLVIQSKCGVAGEAMDNSRGHIMRSVESSLRRLGIDHLDILLLHWPDNLVEPDEVARAFDELKASGKVRYFGVSNHNPWQIELLKEVVRQPIVANQIQLGLAHWYTVQDRYKAPVIHGFEGAAVLDYCRAHDIQVQAYSPLRATGGMPPNLLNPAPDASVEVKRTAQLLADIGHKYGTTPAVIMLAWLLRHPAHIVPIIGGTKPEYVIENCTADRIDLTREEWYSLLHSAAEIESLPAI